MNGDHVRTNMGELINLKYNISKDYVIFNVLQNYALGVSFYNDTLFVCVNNVVVGIIFLLFVVIRSSN